MSYKKLLHPDPIRMDGEHVPGRSTCSECGVYIGTGVTTRFCFVHAEKDTKRKPPRISIKARSGREEGLQVHIEAVWPFKKWGKADPGVTVSVCGNFFAAYTMAPTDAAPDCERCINNFDAKKGLPPAKRTRVFL